MSVPLAPPPFTWTGCYAGAQASGGWGQKTLNDPNGIPGFGPLGPLDVRKDTSAKLQIRLYLAPVSVGEDGHECEIAVAVATIVRRFTS